MKKHTSSGNLQDIALTRHASRICDAAHDTSRALAQANTCHSAHDTTHTFTRRSFVKAAALTAALGATALSTGIAATGCVSTSTSNTNSQTGQAIKGGCITAAFAHTASNFSPIGTTNPLVIAANWHVFEGLYEIDFHTYNTYNALAKAKPVKVSDTEYEITLRDGAKFSDGREVTSADVVCAFEKNMADETYSAFLSFIEKVSAKNSKTTTFKLKYAFESMLEARLALVKIFPSDVSLDSLKANPVGSGPWMYNKINGEDGTAMEFEPNNNYNGSYSATAQWMRWEILKASDARSNAFMQGRATVAETPDEENAKKISKAGYTVEYSDGFEQPYLMFNMQKAPFSDSRVRQAFFYAIDTERLISNAVSGKANAVTSFLPTKHENYNRASKVYTYDPDLARTLLEEAEVQDLEFTLNCDDHWVADLAEQIKENLEAVGVKCNLNIAPIDWASMAPSDAELPFDVCLAAGDPTCFGSDVDLLLSWWYGDNVWTRGRTCWQKAPDSKWGELSQYMQAARVATGSTQQENWNKCFDIISEEVPLYPLFHRKIATAWNQKKIADFKPISTTGLVFIGSSCAE